MPDSETKDKENVCCFDKLIATVLKMKTLRLIPQEDLAALAKSFREKSGKTIQQAEEMPELSLTKLRIRIIETFSPHRVRGPVFWLEQKK